MAANLPKSVQLPVSIASATTTSLVAAVAGARITVVSGVFYAGTATTMNMQSHATTANKTGTTGVPVCFFGAGRTTRGWMVHDHRWRGPRPRLWCGP